MLSTGQTKNHQTYGGVKAEGFSLEALRKLRSGLQATSAAPRSENVNIGRLLLNRKIKKDLAKFKDYILSDE